MSCPWKLPTGPSREPRQAVGKLAQTEAELLIGRRGLQEVSEEEDQEFRQEDTLDSRHPLG